jgi:DNA polymerase I
VLQERLARLRRGDVLSSSLVTTIRVSKRLEACDRQSRTTAALERARRKSLEYAPSESVSFVVVDDEASGAERVQLAFEAIDGYDADRYATELVRAAESVLSPLGWRESEIRSYLADRESASLALYRTG